MAELYVALTGLPVSEDGEGLPRLPVAERLLSRAERRAAPPDWRRWALAFAGLLAPEGDLPVGRTLAAHHGIDPGDDTWFVATPVHLVAGLTRLHFDPHGALGLRDAEALAARFASGFGDPSLTLVAAGETLLLRAAGHLDVATVDPAGCGGREVTLALPTGPDARRLERIWTEIQMWLYSDPPASREGPPVNALWLWGAGRAPLAGSARFPVLATADPFLAAIAANAQVAPHARLERWSLADLARDGHSLADLDAVCFAPLAAALGARQISEARIHAGSHEFVLRRRQRWRRWIRPQPWWQLAPERR